MRVIAKRQPSLERIFDAIPNGEFNRARSVIPIQAGFIYQVPRICQGILFKSLLERVSLQVPVGQYWMELAKRGQIAEGPFGLRSEEHTSELQSREHLV